MTASRQTISPVDGGFYAQRPFAAETEIDAVTNLALQAQAV